MSTDPGGCCRSPWGTTVLLGLNSPTRGRVRMIVPLICPSEASRSPERIDRAHAGLGRVVTVVGGENSFSLGEHPQIAPPG